MVKNPNWQEAYQLAIYKCDREVGLPRNNSSYVVRERLEPAIPGFQGRTSQPLGEFLLDFHLRNTK